MNTKSLFKLLGVLAALLLVFTFSACSDDDTGGTTGGSGGDTTAPTWITAPSVQSSNASSITVRFSINEPGIIRYLALSNGSPAPTVAQITNTGALLAAPIAGTVYTVTPGSFAADTLYDIYLVAMDGTLNVMASATKVTGRTATSGTPDVVTDTSIEGVTVPATGGTPVTTITECDQYTGTVTWAPSDNPFLASTVYIATITLTPKAGWTLTGVGQDVFTVTGASTVNAASSGVITATFPATAAPVVPITVAEIWAAGATNYPATKTVNAVVTLPMGQNVHIQEVGGGRGLVLRFASAGEGTTANLQVGDKVAIGFTTVALYNTYLQITGVYATNVSKTGTETVVYENIAAGDFNTQDLLDTVSMTDFVITTSIANNTTVNVSGIDVRNVTGATIDAGTYSFARGFVSYFGSARQLELRTPAVQLGTYTPPALAITAGPTASGISDTSANINLTINKSADAYCLVLPAADPDPSAAAVKAGSSKLSVSGAQTFAMSGLTATTSYKAWVYVEVGAETVGPVSVAFDTTAGGAAPLVFINSDFESDLPGPMDGAFSYSSDAYAGSRSIAFVTNYPDAGSVSTRTYNLSGTNLMYANGTAQYITFYFKGTVSGSNPGLRFQVAAGGTVANYYDINSIVSGTTLTVTPTTGGTFPTTTINVTNWTKVRLDLTGVDWGGQSITFYPLRFRARQQNAAAAVDTAHNWVIDDVRFE